MLLLQTTPLTPQAAMPEVEDGPGLDGESRTDSLTKAARSLILPFRCSAKQAVPLGIC